jgi:8-oxo-dGTP pyrophosphatase MutT (NUDIX family)
MSDAPQASNAPAKARALRPRDAATLIIVDDASGELRVLLGRRRQDMVFMPGRYVFPGGRVDRSDRHITVLQDLKPQDLAKLQVAMKGTPSVARARALALAAVRETYEEAGLLIGIPIAPSGGGEAIAASAAQAREEHADAEPPRGLLRKTSQWHAFFAAGFRPSLSRLTFFARAITPPGRPRRYDTRFFCVPAGAIAHRVEVGDGELSDLEWHSIAEARSLALPNITRVVLEDLGERAAAGALEGGDHPVPFYHRHKGSFRRDLIRSGDLDRRS